MVLVHESSEQGSGEGGGGGGGRRANDERVESAHGAKRVEREPYPDEEGGGRAGSGKR